MCGPGQRKHKRKHKHACACSRLFLRRTCEPAFSKQNLTVLINCHPFIRQIIAGWFGRVYVHCMQNVWNTSTKVITEWIPSGQENNPLVDPGGTAAAVVVVVVVVVLEAILPWLPTAKNGAVWPDVLRQELTD